MLEPTTNSLLYLFCKPNMDKLHNAVVMLALLATNLALPASVTKGVSLDYFDSNDPNSNYFSVNSQDLYKDGQCIRETKISGHGIKDIFESPCSQSGQSSLVTGNKLIYGNPKEENKLVLYSDMPNTLIVMLDGKCTKKTYTITGNEATSISSPLTDTDCAEIKQKADDEIEKNRIYWEEWNRNFTAYMSSIFPNFQSTNSDVSLDEGDGDGKSDDDESNNESENNNYNENEKDDEPEEEVSEDIEDSDEKPDKEDGNKMTGQSISDYWTDWAKKLEERLRKAHIP